MTNHEYLKKMIAITEKLDQIANHEPFLKLSWDSYMNEMHKVTCDWHYNRRRWPRFFIIVCWVLAILLGLVVISICCFP